MGLADEHERVWNVVVAHVDDGRADQAAERLLRASKDGVHHARRFWRVLNTVQALASVAQAVVVTLHQQVLFTK